MWRLGGRPHLFNKVNSCICTGKVKGQGYFLFFAAIQFFVLLFLISTQIRLQSVSGDPPRDARRSPGHLHIGVVDLRRGPSWRVSAPMPSPGVRKLAYSPPGCDAVCRRRLFRAAARSGLGQGHQTEVVIRYQRVTTLVAARPSD